MPNTYTCVLASSGFVIILGVIYAGAQALGISPLIVYLGCGAIILVYLLVLSIPGKKKS
jgi:hypothetical protein